MAAYKTALEQGIDAEAFWRLTPYQTGLWIQGRGTEQLRLAWFIAAFSRQRRLMPFDRLTAKKKNALGLQDALRGYVAPKLKKDNT